MRRSLLRASLVFAGLLALAGCGRLNRAATINQTTQTSGAAAAAAVQQQLAKQGLTSAHVSCAKSMIVNVGTRTACSLAGANGKVVRFTFSNSHGAIDQTSVRPSS